MFKLRHAMLSAVMALGMSSAIAETITVTTTNPTGAGSLTDAINAANANASSTTIEFNIPGTGDRIINGSNFPAFTTPVIVITSGSQQGQTVLQGPNITGPGQGPTSGLTFNAGSAGSYVQFVTFRNYVWNIVVNTGTINIVYNKFESNQSGYDIKASNAGALFVKGNQFSGAGVLAIAGNAPGAYIIGNTFTGKGLSLFSSHGTRIGDAVSSGPNTFSNISGDAINLETTNGVSIFANTINGASIADPSLFAKGIKVDGVDNYIASNTISGVEGYDIAVSNGWYNRIANNTITGDNGIFNGILIENGLAYQVTGNSITGGQIESNNVSGSSTYGMFIVSGNTVQNNPQGASAFGAITVNGATSGRVLSNTISSNASHGVRLGSSSHVHVINNYINDNGRVGVYVQGGNYNKISRNIIRDNHADAQGGRTGIFLNNANINKSAPVITVAKKVGSNFTVSGTGTVAGDSVEIFLSDRASSNSSLTQNAVAYVTTVYASGTSWSATIPAHNYYGEVYLIATSTDATNNTSTFSAVRAVEINGPTAATSNHGSYYYAEYIPGASYSWWSTLPVSSQTFNGNVATFWFNQTGTGTVNVGYTDPRNGQWKMYALTVTVFGPAKFAVTDVKMVEAAVAPNPFASTTRIKLDAIMGGKEADLNLYDIKGELVYSSKGHKEGEEVELGQNLKAGVYTLQIVSDESVTVERIIKQ